MRIVWLTSAQLEGSSSANATTRYRVLLPAHEMRRLGHEVRIFGLYADVDEVRRAIGTAEVVVFGKLLADLGTARYDGAIRQYGDFLAMARAAGARVAMDVNDDHFDNRGFLDFYQQCGAHAWTTSTPAMAEAMQACGLGPAAVIPDPYEGPEQRPAPPLPTRFPRLFRLLDRVSSQPGRGWRVSLLWFGHPSGLPALAACLPQLAQAAREFPIHLHCLSAPGFGLEALAHAQNASGGGALTISFEPWSSEATWAALRSCDMVLLPADLSSAKSRVKSANRLVEALRAGRFAVAQPLPAYLELEAFAHVADSTAEGILWALRHPLEALQRVQRGQRWIAERLSPETVARQWLNSLQSLQSGTSP